jgi:hypothetical protein
MVVVFGLGVLVGGGFKPLQGWARVRARGEDAGSEAAEAASSSPRASSSRYESAQQSPASPHRVATAAENRVEVEDQTVRKNMMFSAGKWLFYVTLRLGAQGVPASRGLGCLL